jgi:uncharacterized RDD family membrane protein YckC
MKARGLQSGVPLWRRCAAFAYDLLLVTALLMALTGVVILVRGGDPIDPGTLWFQLLLVLAWWFYFGWSWTHGGQTVGMRAWRFRLTTPDGAAVNWRQASLRFLGAGVSLLPLGLGFLWALVDRDHLSWHDRWSQTALRRKDSLPQSQHGEHGHDE